MRYGFVLGFSVLMAGCVSSAPVSTVARSVDAVRSGKLAAFRSELTTEAQATLGTEQEMAAIGQTLSRYSHVEIGPPFLMSSKQEPRERLYKTIIAGAARKGAPLAVIYNVFLRCTLSDQTFHQDELPETCTTLIDDSGIPFQNCTPGTPAFDYVAVVESCGVEKIEEK